MRVFKVKIWKNKEKKGFTKNNEFFVNKFIGATGYECSSIAPLIIIWMRRGGVGMRKYYLTSPGAKQKVDLRDYEVVIVSAIMDVMKDVENISVAVYEKYYEVSPSPSRGDAIAIGRMICKSGLSQYCVQIPKLFSSVEVLTGKEEKNEERKTNCLGGHF